MYCNIVSFYDGWIFVGFIGVLNLYINILNELWNIVFIILYIKELIKLLVFMKFVIIDFFDL